MAKVLDRGLKVTDFEHQLRSYRTNYTWERYEYLYPTSYVLDSTTTILQRGWFWHYIIHNGWYAMIQKKKQNMKKVNFYSD